MSHLPCEHRVNIALVGVGNMGRFHHNVIQQSQEFELTAILEPGDLPDGFNSESASLRVSSLDELLKKDFDAVVVASPTETHYELVSSLLKAGKDVLVEKPAASTATGAEELVRLAESQKRKLAVGHIERMNPVVASISNLLSIKALGRPVFITTQRGGGAPRLVKPGNQVLLDLAVHELDALTYLFGDVVIESGRYHCLKDNRIPDLAELRLSVGGYIPTTVQVDWLSPHKVRTMKIIGEGAVAVADYITQSVEVYGSQIHDHQELMGMAKPLDHPYCQALQIKPNQPINSLARQLEEFYKLLHDQPHELCVGQHIVRSLEMLDEAIAKSEKIL